MEVIRVFVDIGRVHRLAGEGDMADHAFLAAPEAVTLLDVLKAMECNHLQLVTCLVEQQHSSPITTKRMAEVFDDLTQKLVKVERGVDLAHRLLQQRKLAKATLQLKYAQGPLSTHAQIIGRYLLWSYRR